MCCGQLPTACIVSFVVVSLYKIMFSVVLESSEIAFLLVNSLALYVLESCLVYNLVRHNITLYACS